MRIGIVSATLMEVIPLQERLKNLGAEEKEHLYYQYKDLSILFLVTGIGIAQTSLYLGQLLAKSQFNLLINMGIAGAYDKKLALGTVVNVSKDSFGDLGAENQNGQFMDLKAMGLLETLEGMTQFTNPANTMDFLPTATGLTLNTVSGYEPRIEQLKQNHPADIESMEGAAFAMACHRFEQDYLQIRSISNYVEARDTSKWNIPLALNKLTDVMESLLENFAVLKQAES